MNRQDDLFKKVNKRLGWLQILANTAGAGISFFFFSVIFPLPQTQTVQRVDWLSLLSFVVITVLLLWLGFSLFPGAEKKIGEWYYRLIDGADPDDVPMDVKRSVVNNISKSAMVTLGMWFLAGVVTSSLNAVNNRFFIFLFVGIFIVGGVLTTALTYFIGDLLWRPILPVFFPEGGMSQVKGFRLSVFGRLVIVFLIVTVWPLVILVSLSLQRANQLVFAENPQLILDNLLILEIFILVVSLSTSVGMALFVTRGITGPLKSLQEGMGRVEKNDLKVHIAVTSNDELGYLEEHFNQMTHGLRRAEMLRSLLNLYVTPEVASEALVHGVQLGGRLVNCTVLFSDIRDFTGLAESLAPERLIALLNRYMEGMVSTIVAEGGMVNKFGGDSLLAVFGTPLNPDSDHAERAVRTGLAMLETLKGFNETQKACGEPQLRIGIGIATGEAIAGNVGGKERIEYTVIGDTVNLASRLQSMTKEMGQTLIISEDTYRETRSIPVEMKPVARVSVRGKEELVDVWTLESF